MYLLTMIAGAIQLTTWLFSAIDRIEGGRHEY